MKAGFVFSYSLPIVMMMIVSDVFPKHPVLVSLHVIFDANTCFMLEPEIALARDVCFFLINLSGSRSRLLICSVWTDLNIKIKIQLRRQAPEPEPPPTVAPTPRGS